MKYEIFKKTGFIIVFILIVSGCLKNISKETSQNTIVKGKITNINKEHRLKDAYIYVYKNSLTNFKESPFLISGPSNKSGEYLIELPHGKYYFVARKFSSTDPRELSKSMEPGEYYCYYGGNPVPIFQEKASINFNCSRIIGNETAEPNNDMKSGIKGIISHNENPLPEAYVFTFQNTEANFRGPVFTMSQPSDLNGNFELELPPGKYYILAKKKKNVDASNFTNVYQEGKEPTGNITAGPLSTGDYFYYYYNNPITVIEGNFININLPVISKIGRDDVSHASYTSPTRIEGTINDADNKPVPGTRVLAFRRKIMGGETPAFTSNITKKDGKYVINFTEEGIFYLAARNFVGRPPKAGDIFGYYFGTEDHSIIIEKDIILKDILIKTWKVE